MLFVGDIMLDRSVRRQIEKAQDPLYPFVRIADTLRAADLTFGNLEGPVSSRGTNQGSIYSFRFEPVGTINALTYAGFDVVSSANNHILDWGSEALSDTFTQLDEAGIGHTGAGRNYEEANGPFLLPWATLRRAQDKLSKSPCSLSLIFILLFLANTIGSSIGGHRFAMCSTKTAY